MPFPRCRYYDDAGGPIRGGCKSQRCRFAHPDSSDWERAPKPNRTNYHGSLHGRRNSDTESTNTNVADRIASSTWSLPSSPPKRKVSEDRGNDSWANIIDSACGPPESGDGKRTAAMDRNDLNHSNSVWGSSKKVIQAPSSSNSWGAEGSSWGNSDNSTWGDTPATWDKNVAAAWGTLDSDSNKDSGKPSEKQKGKQPQASTSSWGTIEGKKTLVATPAPASSRTSIERTTPVVPPIPTNLPKPSAWSPIEPSSSATSHKAYSNSPTIPQHAPFSIRMSTKPSERLTLKAAEKTREASPVFSERSLSSATVDKQRSHYRKAIEKMVTISLLKQQLEKSQQKLLRWKEIQKSRRFARVRVGGAKKLDDTRRFLTKDCQGIHTRIEREEKSLYDIPDFFASTKLDITGFNEKTAQYLAEVEEWISDMEKGGETAKAEEKQGGDNQTSEEPELSPMLRKWAELKDKVKSLEEKLDDIAAEIEDYRNFDVNEEANIIVQDMLRSKAEVVQPQIQEQQAILLELKAKLQSRQELLQTMQERHKENLNTKAEIEKTLATFAELGEMRRTRILSLRREIINLHNLKPISYREHLSPQIKDFVDTIVNEQVIPAFNALAVQCHKAAEQSHVLAATKIDETLRPIEAFITGIQADAAREANLVRSRY
ncbi:hypothetical protein E1B28_001475 [Marasmius oreades]|uniref:C3H1-type domain-containing protein n=1 Tax=Marasmius oreades TaxID=181124 RepID=A0A9P7V3M9_9AGAR|nr:uncharacterized protein E1B28_001475 [Marasmius oreades]KAG7099649.1 hypothetical protein E1B28_001475 [Marasmius oreades]